MGLLRKAAGGAPPPAAPRQSGLLRRSIRALDDVPPRAAAEDRLDAAQPFDTPDTAEPSPMVSLAPPVREVRAAAQVTAELLAAIEAIPDGVELPSRLFSVVASKLGVRKGALLLYDPVRLVYAPWASQGYDTTTLHRLRIPLGANESFNALANGAPLVLSDQGSLTPYQGFFSSREYSTMSRLILAPLIASERLVGVMLLSDLDPRLPGGDADIVECLGEAARSGSARVDTARERRLAAAGTATVPPPASLEEQASKFIGAGGGAGSPALFMALSLEDYARAVLAGHEHLDPFRLHEDMRYFLGAFVADGGTALSIRQGLFIVGLRDIDAADVDLFLHQLTRHLDVLFGGGGSAGPRILKKRSWPAEGDDVRSLIDYLAS